MKIFSGCLLCCDVDGTLLSNGIIPQENIEKIRFFAENGGTFALATGRSIGAVSAVEKEIKSISKAVFSNGGMIYDYIDDKILFEAQIPKEDYEIIYKVKENYPEIGIELHFGKGVAVYNKTSETDDHEFYENLPSNIYTKEQISKVSLNKVLYTLGDEGNAEKIRRLVEKTPNSCEFLNTSATFDGRKRFYLEQVPIGISKAEGVKKLVNILGIEEGNLFAIGDYYNDLEMLRFASLSAAPCNSPKEVKEKATYITKNVENGAVADFIDYLTKMRRK